MYDIECQSNQEYLIKNNSWTLLKCFWLSLPFLLIALQGDRGLVCDVDSVTEWRNKQTKLIEVYMCVVHYALHILFWGLGLQAWRRKVHLCMKCPIHVTGEGVTVIRLDNEKANFA